MGSAQRGTFHNLRESLLKEGASYSFFQAVRLIRLILRRQEKRGVKDAASIEGRFLRIRPELTLGFPSADIARIEGIPLDEDNRRFIIYTTFLGLYGTSSPLPSFYTEDLLREAADDKSVTRDFIDIINSAVYPLFIRTLLKYNLFLQICEEENREYLERIYCLMGMHGTKCQSLEGEEARRSLLRYGGILSQYPRSALGLKTMLSDSLDGIPVFIRQCIPQMVPVPDDQRASLGLANVTLGEDMYLGSEIADCMGKFRIIIGPIPPEMVAEYLPGGSVLQRAVFLVDSYLNTPLEYDFELLFHQAGIPALSLGEPCSSVLGVNSWFVTDCTDGYITTRYEALAADTNYSRNSRRDSC